MRRQPRAFFNNPRSFFNSQFPIHLKKALAQRTFAIAAKLDLMTTSFAGQERWRVRVIIGRILTLPP
jgi:hypothetical protein